jgi:hypothetical protein
MLRFSWARAAVLGVVSKAVPRCTAQANSLRWRLSNSCGNCRNDWIFKWPWPHSVTQWRESQKHNALLLAEFQKLRFREIWMCFNLDHSRLDSRRFVDGQQFVQADVGQSDSPAFATVYAVKNNASFPA